MKKYPEDIECIFSPVQGVGGIYISNIDAASNINTLNKHNIKAVITACRGYLLQHTPEQLPYYLYLPADDHQSFDISKYFEEAIQFIDSKRKKTNVLVHCMAGVSRSVTLVLAYLIKNHGHTTETAFHTVKKQRRKIDPNSGFLDQLKKFQSLLQQHRRQRSVGNIRKSNIMNFSLVSNRGLTPSNSQLFNSTIHSTFSKPYASVIYSPRKKTSGINPSQIMNNYVSPPKQSTNYNIQNSRSLARTISSQNTAYVSSPSTLQYKSKLSSNIRQYDQKLKDDIRKLQLQNIKLKQALRQQSSTRKPMREISANN